VPEPPLELALRLGSPTVRPQPGVSGLRVRGEIMGPGKDENVGKAQSVLILINPIISNRTRTSLAPAQAVFCLMTSPSALKHVPSRSSWVKEGWMPAKHLASIGYRRGI
jgi:hypothetical protein